MPANRQGRILEESRVNAIRPMRTMPLIARNSPMIQSRDRYRAGIQATRDRRMQQPLGPLSQTISFRREHPVKPVILALDAVFSRALQASTVLQLRLAADAR